MRGLKQDQRWLRTVEVPCLTLMFADGDQLGDCGLQNTNIAIANLAAFSDALLYMFLPVEKTAQGASKQGSVKVPRKSKH